MLAFRLARLPLIASLVARPSGRPEAPSMEDFADLEEIGPLTLKGLLRPVAAFNIVRIKGTV